jgi:hypothetical protein
VCLSLCTLSVSLSRCFSVSSLSLSLSLPPLLSFWLSLASVQVSGGPAVYPNGAVDVRRRPTHTAVEGIRSARRAVQVGCVRDVCKGACERVVGALVGSCVRRKCVSQVRWM